MSGYTSRRNLTDILTFFIFISSSFAYFERAAETYAILERISSFESSPETIAPRYLKFLTVSSFCPFTLISLWVPVALLVIDLAFTVLISILYLEALKVDSCPNDDSFVQIFFCPFLCSI